MALPELERIWWQDGLYFSCTRCGACCGHDPGSVRFTGDELADMARSLGMSPAEFSRKFVWEKYGVKSLRELPNFDCVFLINKCGAGCKIYEVTPSQCKTFPFWPELLISKQAWDNYSLYCPGMNKGKFYAFKEIAESMTRYIYDGITKFL
jgi:Fe-S-cluster containining protein